jgi:ribosomal protein L29
MKKVEEIKKYQEMSLENLKSTLKDLKKELVSNSLKVQAEKLTNYSVISKTKKSIARINTLISAKSAE